MECNNCGKKIRDNSKFCPFCGKKVERNDLPPVPIKPRVDNLQTLNEDEHVKKTEEQNECLSREDCVTQEKKESLLLLLMAIDDVKQSKIKITNSEKKDDVINIASDKDSKKSSANTDARDHVAQNAFNNESIYEQQLKIKAQKEKKVDNIEHVVAIILALFWMAKAGMTLQVDLLNAITTIVVGSLIEFLLIPFVNRYKKVEGIYKAQDKYDRYQSLKGSCDEQVIIQSIEIESSIGNQSKGLLYFLLCVIVILLLFAMF